MGYLIFVERSPLQLLSTLFLLFTNCVSGVFRLMKFFGDTFGMYSDILGRYLVDNLCISWENLWNIEP